MMFRGKNHSFHPCVFYYFAPLFAIKICRVEKLWAFIPISPFNVSERVETEMNECVELQLLPFELGLCGNGTISMRCFDLFATNQA